MQRSSHATTSTTTQTLPALGMLLACAALATSCAPLSSDDGASDAAMGSTFGVVAPEGDEQALTTCGDGPTVLGIDVSIWQGQIDWAAVARDGVVFAVSRVSDGLHSPDSRFAENIQGSRANGILTGAYQFFRPGQDAIAQADMFVDAVLAQGGIEMPPVIDVEATDGMAPGAVAAAVQRWVAHVEGRLHRQVMIYTGKYFWQGEVGNPNMSDHPLWHAQYTSASCPNIADTWPRWSIWQFSSTGSIAGIAGNVDVNRFNGTRDQLLAFASVGDPQCIADANFGGCNGSVITHCDEQRHVSTGDCGFFGATCSTLGGTPHCVHPMCTIELGTENGTFCVDGTDKLATCTNGRYEEGDCAFFGATCSEEGGSGHCVHPYCPANLDGGETGTFCRTDTIISTCTLGHYEEGDCGAYGATCSEEGGTAHCVHFLCHANLDGREDGTFCVDDHTLDSCTLGVPTSTDCSATGSVCVERDGAAACVSPACAADPAACPPPPSTTGGDDATTGAGDDDGAAAAEADLNGPARVTVQPVPDDDGSCASAPTSSLAPCAIVLLLARRRRRC